jgi:hypothetical protein
VIYVLDYPILAEYLLHLRLYFKGMVKRARGLVFEKLSVKKGIRFTCSMLMMDDITPLKRKNKKFEKQGDYFLIDILLSKEKKNFSRN